MFHRGKALQAVVTLVSSREHVIEMGRGFSGPLVQQEGSDRQSGGYRSEDRYGRHNMLLHQDDLRCGCLCRHRCVATQKYSEQHNEPFVNHQISLLSNSLLFTTEAMQPTPPASRSLSPSPENKRPDFVLRGTQLLQMNEFTRAGVRRSVLKRTRVEAQCAGAVRVKFSLTWEL